jgi:hypothetical protein
MTLEWKISMVMVVVVVVVFEVQCLEMAPDER